MLRPPPRATAILKCYFVVWFVHQAYFSDGRSHRACPSGGGQMAAERTAHATPFCLPRTGGRRCPAIFGRNRLKLQVVDMAVVSGKPAVVATAISNPVLGNRLMTK